MRIGVAILAATLLALAFWRIEAPARGLEVARHTLGGAPVTVYALPGAPPAPSVVIAHGFAGSQQLMQPFAVTLAQAGYVAVTFDALGHGGNRAPLTGDVAAVDGATAALVAQIAEVAEFAAGLPRADGRLALLGHSMSSDLVVRAAAADPRVRATIGVSLYSREITATVPPNLLVITGAWEPGLTGEALRIAGLATDGAAIPFVTYGDTGAGTARRAVLAPGVEHVGVLYSPVSLTEARAWLNAVFARDGMGPVAARGPWIGLWALATLGLGWGLAGALPRVAASPPQPPSAPRGWRGVLLAGIVPALLTPLIAGWLPRDLLPVPVADYLSAHFLLYGLFTAAMLALGRRGRGDAAGPAPARLWPGRLILAVAGYATFALLVVYLPIDRYVTAFAPQAGRLVLFAMLLAGLLPYFLADERLTRGPGAPRFAYPATKLMFLVSLAIAIALDPERLFFLILILPVMLLFFVIFGLFSRWSRAATGTSLVAALANAALFAWAIAVTFPLLGP